MIGLSARTFNANGAFVFRDSELKTLRDWERRVTRSKTLDGGTIIEDSGVRDADRTFNVDVTGLAATTVNLLDIMLRAHPDVIICTREGAFLAVPSRLGYKGGITSFTLMIKLKLSQ